MARVVVIDDRVTNRNIIARLAASVEEGLQVDAFASPVAALHAIDEGLLPDLIITDYNMPAMDGAGFITAARRRVQLSDVPIVVVTIFEDREFCYRALAAGATDFLLSPLDHLEFKARARNLLTLRRQQLLMSQRTAGLEAALASRGGAGSDESYAAVMHALPVGVSVVDGQGRLMLANLAYAQLLNLDRDGAHSRPVETTHGEDFALKSAILDDKVRETGTTLVSELKLPQQKGTAERLVLVKAPFESTAGAAGQVITVAMDAADWPEAPRAEGSPTTLDPLTSLLAATAFEERIATTLGQARKEHGVLAVLHIDLDRFKGINSAFGTDFGDAVLRAVALRIRQRLGGTAELARLPSDEFGVLERLPPEPEAATDLCRRVADVFAEPFLIRSREIHLSASIGITLAPADAREADALLRNAELAMYRAKASGRDTYRFFAAEMNQQARRAVLMERELRQALAAEQFVVHYQPQVCLATGDLVGAEALVRWNHPSRGLVRPGEFIALAEDIGLMAPLSTWVLRTACRQQKAWLDRGVGGRKVSVNLSPVQLRERGVEWMIERVLRETGLPPECLDVELTENAVLDKSQAAAQSLRYLHQLGVTLSLDDFGTGYSSLAYIKRLPVGRLKIDRSFVQSLESNANDDVIVRAIINLGHSLGLKVIAEGVETEGQLGRLRALGCDEVQGHLISVPLSADALETFLNGPLKQRAPGR